MNYEHLPAFVIAERDALLIEIQEAFQGVDRNGGVSWSETEILDDCGSGEERLAARAKDVDTCWQDLLDDPDWICEMGYVPSFSFLDAIGFRYYLPVAMVRSIREGDGDSILFHLTLGDDNLRNYSLSQWSLLDLRQRVCVKRFLQYMGIFAAWQHALYEESEWFGAVNSYWAESASE